MAAESVPARPSAARGWARRRRGSRPACSGTAVPARCRLRARGPMAAQPPTCRGRRPRSWPAPGWRPPSPMRDPWVSRGPRRRPRRGWRNTQGLPRVGIAPPGTLPPAAAPKRTRPARRTRGDRRAESRRRARCLVTTTADRGRCRRRRSPGGSAVQERWLWARPVRADGNRWPSSAEFRPVRRT